MTKDEVLKLALEALTATMSTHGFQKYIDQAKEEAITAIKQALNDVTPLAAPVQGPVAIVSGYYGGQCVILPTEPARLFNSGTAFYTTPPNVATPLAAQRQSARSAWVGLTDEEIKQDASWFFPSAWWTVCKDFARTIENELKEKNSD